MTSERTLKWTAVWAFANLAGIVAFLISASETWSVDFALGGFSIYNGLVNLLPLLYCLPDLVWLVFVLVQLGQKNGWQSIIVWCVVMGVWAGVIGIECRAATYWTREADMFMSSPPSGKHLGNR